MKCKAHLNTYEHGCVTIDFDLPETEDIMLGGELHVFAWEKTNNDTAYRVSFEDEHGNLY